MTKAKAIKIMIELGFTEIVKEGKFDVSAIIPVPFVGAGKRGLFTPRDLLREIGIKIV